MDRNFSRIVELLRREGLGVLNEREKTELDGLLGDESIFRMYQELKEGTFVAEKLEGYKRFPARLAYRKFLNQHQSKREVRAKLWIISVVAAVFVLFIGISILFEDRVEPATVVADELVVPGSRKALLYLPGGECIKIEGDSVKVKENGGTKIKYSNGIISYQSTDTLRESEYNELIVPLAGECFIILDDGTKVWMNSGSRLKYPVKFIGEERKIFLDGEAYFEVTRASRPFIVNTSLGDVRVLGTSFNVKAYRVDDQVWTTLVTGRVSFKGKEEVELQPGQQVIAWNDGALIRRDVNVEEYVGWKDGLFVFKNQRLEDMMRDLSRWYDMRVTFREESLKNIQFTGNLKRYDRVETLMELLRRTNELNYIITGNNVIIYK